MTAPRLSTSFRMPLAFTLLGAASVASACCGIGEGRVRLSSQETLVIWDSARKVEHFMRAASFESEGKSLEFIAPTPGVPTLAEIGDDLFPFLNGIAEAPPGMGCGRPMDQTKSGTAATLEVLQEVEVAGYRATTLKVRDVADLRAWARRNGLKTTPGIEKWLENYIRKGWALTAFRVIGKETRPFRMTFRTDRPYNPYAVPKENQGSAGATLRMNVLAPVEMGPDGVEMTRSRVIPPLDASERSRLASILRMRESDLPATLRGATFDAPFAVRTEGDIFLGDSPGSWRDAFWRNIVAFLIGCPLVVVALFGFGFRWAIRRRYRRR